jgi:hypothetical protein
MNGKLENGHFLLDEVDKQMQNCITIDGNIDRLLYIFIVN